ncbi:hypothetical protein [Cohnella abietis]|uniref:Uncharacterized protein n=1 Tax=Cohnella abietis TaxID=2507935 RepID=A0A3T1D2C1_9BACL|nr:hypothetical protein [Cohnella abietis]BBI32252.1 hypothetical protein KCTCHS21_16510 [Cohnella abietis]
MQFIQFISASMFEYITFSIFAMLLFRFPVKEYIAKFCLSSFILALVSNTLQVESLQNISPLINVFLLIFLLSIILRIRLFHSIIMVVISYLTYTLVQWLLLTIFIKLGLYEEIKPYTSSGYVLQAASGICLVLISLFIYFTKGGFSYIQSSSRFFKDEIKGNRMFTVTLVLSLFVVFVVNGMYIGSVGLPYYFYTISIIILLILVILIYFSVRKDNKNDK